MTESLWSRTGVSQATNFVVPSWMEQVTDDFLVKPFNTGRVTGMFSGTLCFPACSLLHRSTQTPTPRAAACSLERWHSQWLGVFLILSPVCIKLLARRLFNANFVSKCTHIRWLDLKEKNRKKISYVGAGESTFLMALSNRGVSPHPP